MSERVDDLMLHGRKIIQREGEFCFSIDSVLLAHFPRFKRKFRALDLGTGTGVIPILMEARYRGHDYIGLEIQEDVADMARRSVAFNNLTDRIVIENVDVKDALSLYKPGSFDVITTNPPYIKENDGLINPNDTKALSRHELRVTLEDVVRISSKLLKNKGKFYMIHRPSRLMEIMSVMREYNLEVKRLRTVHSYVDKEASMVLIEALRDGGAFMKVEKPLIIYDSDGKYMEEVGEIYYGE